MAALDAEAVNLVGFDLIKKEPTKMDIRGNKTIATWIEKINKEAADKGYKATAAEVEGVTDNEKRGRQLEIEYVGGVARQLFGPDSRKPVSCPDSKKSPFQMHVQISAGGGSCSGVMVGPRHVLTAGHCIYNFYDGNGNELSSSAKGWKSNVYVGYSREWGCPTSSLDAGTDTDGTRTVRWVAARWMMTYNGFVNNGDADYDIALIELQSRPATRRSSSTVTTNLPWMTFGSYGSPSYDWTWCTAGWPGDKSPRALHAECNRGKVQDIESSLFEMELDGAQGQSGSPLWPAIGGPNGDHGSMYSGEAGAATGVFSLLYQQTYWFFGWHVINESNDFARINGDRFASMCAWITSTIRAGEFNPCGNVG